MAMARGKLHKGAVLLLLLAACYISLLEGMKRSEKLSLKKKVLEMFRHAYNSYMDHAYPADELMPLSCKGRYRGSETPGRGDIDDALGNFSLTLVDTLDTLAVLGDIEKFEEAILLVIKDVRFDKDIVVSVFETNIRMLGGLLGGHVMAVHLKSTGQGLSWYNNELLDKAKDLGYRLLPAFNTTTGVPFPRVNLLHGIDKDISRTGHESDTCTACAGTMLLEFAALSRMTGETVFEDKAHRVMEVLWTQRHRNSDLVGTVINIHNGDWVRRESGVGAGIDSYYEYLLKGYILLGDSTYLDRFNKHYSAIKRYVNQGPMLVDVHMHKPTTISRNFMDSLGAFWPGLQVLKGDLRAAIETHEMLYQVMKRHNFLPEAFTTDFRVHWAQHPLRPEFVESTYFLYKATSDPYYLEVGKKVIDNLEEYARVPCGYAAIKDVTTNQKEDQMDSFVMSETFKYLFLLFSEHSDLFIDVDDYVFTTEAHLLPLTLAMHNYTYNYTTQVELPLTSDLDFSLSDTSCPNDNLYPGNIASFAQKVRHPLRHLVESSCPKPGEKKQLKIHARDFVAGNKAQLSILKEMGIRLATMADGRVQLLHTASDAATTQDAEAGMVFMQEMIEFSKNQQQQVQQEPRFVQYLSAPYLGSETLSAGPAQFGTNLADVKGVRGYIELAEPLDGCHTIQNAATLAGKIVLLRRGNCMFVDKARNIEAVGAIAGIVMDNHPGSTALQAPLFAMSGDGKSDVNIPMVFLFSVEGDKVMSALGELGALEVFLCSSPLKQGEDFDEQLAEHSTVKSSKGSSKTYTYQDAYYEFTKGNVNEIKGPPLPRQTCSNKVKVIDSLEGPGPTVVKHAEYLVFDNNEFELRVQTRIDELNHAVIEEKQYILAPQGATKLRITFVVPLSEKRPDRLDVTGFYRQVLVSVVSRTNLGALQNQGQYWTAFVFLMEGIFAFGKMNLLSSDYEYYMKELKHDLVLTDPADDKYVEGKVGEYVSERMAGGSILVYRETGSHMQIFKMDATPTQPKKPRNYATGQELDGVASKKRNDEKSSKKLKPMYVDGSEETKAISESHRVESSLGSKMSVEQEGGSYKIDLRYHLDNIQAKKDLMKGIEKWQEHEKTKTIDAKLVNSEYRTKESGGKNSQPADSGDQLTEQADRTKPRDEL